MSTPAMPDLTIEQFEAGDVDAELFDHEAHVRIGWLYLQRFGLSDAIRRFEVALQRLTAKLGVPDKYHATITWLYLLLINERSRTDEDWHSFRARNRDLVDDSKTTPGRFYSNARLFSDEARAHFVLPDKLAG